MTVTDFNENYAMYENMAVWDITSLDDFFTSHALLYEIFEKEYGLKYADRGKEGFNLNDSDIMVVSKLFDHFGDKHFLVFEKNDKHHKELIAMQTHKVINFGMDISEIDPKKIYVLEMDKTKDPHKYDH